MLRYGPTGHELYFLFKKFRPIHPNARLVRILV
jgi:hypothetical protein